MKINTKAMNYLEDFNSFSTRRVDIVENEAEDHMNAVVEYNILYGIGLDEYLVNDRCEKVDDLDEIFYSVIHTPEFQKFNLSEEEIEMLHNKIMKRYI